MTESPTTNESSSASAIDIARERQLDWLLDEAHGATAAVRDAHRRARTFSGSWLYAAIALFAAGIAVAVSVLHEPRDVRPAQDPGRTTWYHVYDVGAFDVMPADVVNVRCYDFDDDKLATIGRFPQIERLDLSGMRPDRNGVSTMVQITDAGVRHLLPLIRLRELSLAGCQRVEGSTLKDLRELPLLESLDLTQTSVTSAALAALPLLPSLRALSLDRCLGFHGRSLADIARIPGLRELSLNGCATVSAADLMQLKELHALRALDLTECVGATRMQTAAILDDVTNGEQDEPESPPRQDGVGITDEVVIALRGLPLEHLVLDGCYGLTDRIGAALGGMQRLKHLGIASLPKTTADLLAALPGDLEQLNVADNHHYDPAGLATLERFAKLRELDLSGVTAIDDDLLAEILAGMQLTKLRIGGVRATLRAIGPDNARRPQLTSACAATIAAQRQLRDLDVSMTDWLDAAAGRQLATLPALRHLECRGAMVATAACVELAASGSLRSISFIACKRLELAAVRALQRLPLADIDLYATGLDAGAVRDLARPWRGCRVRLPNGSLHAPDGE